jgi:hypothetical protein
MSYSAGAFLADLESPFAWPGGYPRYFVCADGEALSFEEAKANEELIVAAIRENDRNSDWRVIGCQINWEDPDLICVGSGKKIPSAYADDEDENA